MKVWIISESSPPPSFPGITRHYNLAKALEKMGNEVTIVTINFSHLKKIPLINTDASITDTLLEGIRFKLIQSISYQKNGLKRLLSMFLFSFRVASLKVKDLPDIIIGSSPSPFSAYAAHKLSKKLRIPFIMEIRDLWPETLTTLGNMNRWNPIIGMMKYVERALYKNSDHIISLLPGAYEYLHDFKVPKTKVTYLPNFVNMADLLARPKPKKLSEKFNVYYSGSLGLANSIETLLESAKILQSLNQENIIIHIIGDGPNRSKLIVLAKELNLKNVIFQETVKKSEIYSTLENADVFVILFKNTNLYQWGFSPNKLFDYMAMGRPIICSVKTKYDLVKEANCGISIPPEDPAKLAEAIIQMAKAPRETLIDLGTNGRNYAEQFHSLEKISAQLSRILRTQLSPLNPKFMKTPF